MVAASSPNRSRKPLSVGGDLEESAREITRFAALDVPALRQRWTSHFGDDPSPNLGRALLIRAIAYRLQEKALAGLKTSTQRVLDRLGDDRSTDAPQSIPQRRPSAGTVLIRQWRGVSHRVTVLDHEVVYRERRYKSLSEVARVITGSRWSGPLFFGLNRRAREAVNGECYQTLCNLHPQVLGRRIGAGLQLAACAARGVRGDHQKSGG
jgi:hypothetical protein